MWAAQGPLAPHSEIRVLAPTAKCRGNGSGARAGDFWVRKLVCWKRFPRRVFGVSWTLGVSSSVPMGNVFRQVGLLSVALVLCGACSGAPEDEPNGDGLESYSGAKDAPGAPGV